MMQPTALSFALLIALAACVTAQADLPGPQCVPFNGGQADTGLLADYDSLQDFCKQMKDVDDAVFDQQFRQAATRSTSDFTNPGFPLKGCVAGCMVGKASGANAVWRSPYQFVVGGGFWTGDCFKGTSTTNPNGPTDMVIYVAPTQAVSNWTKGVPGIPTLPGKVGVATSRYDGLPTFTMGVPGVPVRDEMRTLAPGAMIGKSSINLLPGVIGDTVAKQPLITHFYLFQVCSKRQATRYPTSMSDRQFF